MKQQGKFFGIGVGPGPAGYIPVAAVEALQKADVIFAPKAKNNQQSVALQCLTGIDFDQSKVREIEFNMEPDKTILSEHYDRLAEIIAAELSKGSDVAYLTIGDTLTYSTYNYVIASLRKRLPELQHQTFPGITSYAAAAAALDWPLGIAKERTLILPCPEDAISLRHEIESHDVIVLMKIGSRLPWVITLLNEIGIAQYCAFARKVGLAEEVVCNDINTLKVSDKTGNLAVMLIRKKHY